MRDQMPQSRKVLALVPSERERWCDHALAAYGGSVPGTGPIVCRMCGSRLPRFPDAQDVADFNALTHKEMTR